MRDLKKLVLVSVFCLLAVGVQAASKEWLHVNVNQSRGDEEKVRINIPISLIEVMLPMVEEKAVAEGKIRLHEKDFRVEDLRKIWKSVKDEGDTEYLSVEKRGENFRVFTKGNFLMVQSDTDSKSKVNIKLPMAVVDAMLSGDGEQLNLMAAVKALKDSGVRDIISVEDDDSKVMVWIDEQNIPLERE